MNKKSSYEGLQGHIRTLKTPMIEVFRNEYPDRDYTIELDCPECTCICPKTGLPDFVTVRLSYVPDKVCLELKSFKLYLVCFRDVGIFHENLVNKILDDVVKACRPRQAKVEGAVNPRGGIQTTVTAEYKSAKR
ncbi:MAG: NADPH-dependent 7-cyano-7-deazaguanine reductase QueF [Candidatus Omnitrophica bacterium]|nr:NADPH-dependent 7-cyano-7-deazaguanine reductase QueF [Candidatus Omnitrophota bacterium]